MLVLQVFIVTAFVIEWLLSRKKLYEPVGMMLHYINAHTCFAVSIFITWNFIDRPAVGGCLLQNGAITWLKLISYFLANQDYRITSKIEDGDTHKATLSIIDNLDAEDFEITYPRYVLGETSERM